MVVIYKYKAILKKRAGLFYHGCKLVISLISSSGICQNETPYFATNVLYACKSFTAVLYARKCFMKSLPGS